MLANGTTGFVHSDYLRATGAKSQAGLPIYEATTDQLNVRPTASTDLPPVGQLNTGDRAAVFGQTMESNKYAWMKLLTSDQLIPSLNRYLSAPVTSVKTLDVAKRGASGRVTGIRVNGGIFTLSAPDNFRSMLGGLNSTLFDIEETGRYTILGANGAAAEYPVSANVPYVITGLNNKTPMKSEMLVLNGAGQARLATRDQRFLITGHGWGHGLGMSQDGAVALAQAGKDYSYILSLYYPGTTIK
jgi:stage II sporulation protein D